MSQLSFLSAYKSIVFDCDGVILNSNKIKTQAFYKATKHFGNDVAQALVDYHVLNGGISRYAKFEYFFTKILNQSIVQDELDNLLTLFSEAVKTGLMKCEVADHLELLKQRTPDAKWSIVSGSDQEELREVFSVRKLDHYFEGGIFGSPDTKDIILSRELANLNISKPALFIGDSKYDYLAASSVNVDFVFISAWSEIKNWDLWVRNNNIKSVVKLSDLSGVSFEKGNY